MKVNQRDVVEVVFPLPNGQSKLHPAIVISNEVVYDIEEIYYCVMLSTKQYNDEFVFEITPEMFVNKTKVSSYAKCQLINFFTEIDILKRSGSIKVETFKKLMKKINESVFSFECD